MNTTKFLVIAVIAHFLSACGGGSSSSGGGEGISVVAVYDGTYQTGLYSGTISFELSSNRQATMSITGVECLPSTPIGGLKGTLTNGQQDISGLIETITPPGNVSARFPENGGSGEFTLGLSTDIGCKGASIGTVSVTRR